jgi:hypothetical protein
MREWLETPFQKLPFGVITADQNEKSKNGSPFGEMVWQTNSNVSGLMLKWIKTFMEVYHKTSLDFLKLPQKSFELFKYRMLNYLQWRL